MSRKRVVVGIGLLTGGIAMATCARHCRRVMSQHWPMGKAPAPAG